MKTMLLRSLVLVLVLCTLSVTVTAQDPVPTIESGSSAKASAGQVPILSDLPVLSHLFRQDRRALWIELESESRDGGGSDAPIDPWAGWAMRELPKAVPGVDSVEFVETREHRVLAGGENRHIRLRTGLEVRGSETARAAARAWLEGALAQRGIPVSIRVEIVSWQRERERPNDRVVRALGPDELRTVREGFRDKAQFELVTAPHLLVLSGQRASVQLMNQTAYVKDFDVEIAQGTVIADPVIDVVNDGFVFDVVAVVHPDGKTVGVEANFSSSALIHPIQEFETRPLGVGQAVTIQLPVVSTCRWESEELRLASGEAGFVVTGLSRGPTEKGKEPQEIALLVEVALVPREATPLEGGKVWSVDREQGLVTARWDSDPTPDFSHGRHVRALRDGREVGSLIVREVAGRILVLEVSSGEVKAGDRLR